MISFFNTKHIKTVFSILEILFLALSAVYFFWQESLATMFQLPYPEWFDEGLLWSLFAIAVMRLIMVGPLQKEFWLSLCLAAIYYLIYSVDGYRFLLYLAVLTVGYLNIDHRKILRIWLAAVGTIVCITMVAGVNGFITNLLYYKNGIRSSWGFNYPTDFASIVLFLLLILWASQDRLPDWLMLMISIGSILLSRFIARSFTSFFCSILFFVFILYHIINRIILSKHLRLQWIDRWVNVILTILFPMLLVFFLLLMLAYYKNMEIGIWIDKLMSTRISLAVEAAKQYGFHIFGTPFEMVGWGSSSFQFSGYSFVDSTYALIPIRYGWALLIAVCLFWGWMVRKAIKCGNRKLALIMGIIAVHSFSEHHFMDVYYNILLVMPFAAYVGKTKNQKQETEKKKYAAAVITATICLIALIFIPGLFTRLKTVIQLKGLCGGGDNGWLLLGIIFGLLIVAVFAVWAVYQIIHGITIRYPIRKLVLPVVIFLLCSSIAAVSLIYSDQKIGQAVKATEITVLEQETMNLITSSAKGKVFSDLLPAVYQRWFDHVDNSVLSGGDLARFQGSTILIDVDTEYPSFIKNGFLFTQVSEKHAIYTNDSVVIKALTDAGYHLTGYYNHTKEIDLSYEAELNSLVYSEEKGLLLNGPEHALFFGIGLNLHPGKYAVTFELYLPDDVIDSVNAICTLRVSDSWGEHLLQENEVTLGDFEKDGTLCVTIPFSITRDTSGIEFLVFPAEGQAVAVRKISYCRTPD